MATITAQNVAAFKLLLQGSKCPSVRPQKTHARRSWCCLRSAKRVQATSATAAEVHLALSDLEREYFREIKTNSASVRDLTPAPGDFFELVWRYLILYAVLL